MQKLIALILVASLTSGCATVPTGSYGNGTAQSGQQDTSAQNGQQGTWNAPAQSSGSFWSANTIFWTVIAIVAVGAAAKAANKTCHTGPRGGTYTVTANGNKNYSGC